MAFEGDSEIIWFEGNDQAFYEWQYKEKGSNWQPLRVQYRPLKNG